MKRPLPTASIMPSWGFSLAVSGRTIPLLVFSSRSTGLITTRSPSGRSRILLPPCRRSAACRLRTLSTHQLRVLIVAHLGRPFQGPLPARDRTPRRRPSAEAQAGIGVERGAARSAALPLDQPGGADHGRVVGAQV